MILIQTDKQDQSTDDVLDWLYFLHPDKEVYRLNGMQEIDSLEYRISPAEECVKITTPEREIDFSEIKHFWYRRGGFSFNKIVGNSIYNKLDINVWQANKLELQHLLASVSNSLHDTYKGINRAEENDTNKLINLKMAKQVGLKIPHTLICTEINSLLSFVKVYKKVISKAINAGVFQYKYNDEINYDIVSETKLITAEEVEALSEKLHLERFMPSLFQEYIDKRYELRIFYFFGEIYCMAIFSQENEKTKIDFRNYDYSRPNRTVPYQLPQEVEKQIIELMNAIQLNCGSIDMIYSLSKEYYFLEVNPIGQFQWLDHDCNYFLDKRIAEYLSKTNL